MPGAGKKEEGGERDSGPDDDFGVQQLEATFSNANSTFNVDPESAEYAKMTFAFRTMKTDRDARRSKIGVLTFIDSVTEANDVKQLVETMDLEPTEKLQVILEKKVGRGDEVLWEMLREKAANKRLEADKLGATKMTRANQRVLRISEERKLGYQIKSLSTKIKSLDAGTKQEYTKAVEAVNLKVKSLSAYHQNFRAHMTAERTETLWQWFYAQRHRIAWARREIPTYQDVDNNVSRQIAAEVKTLFAEFRLVLDCDQWFHTGSMRTELLVPVECIIDINTIIADMRRETSFEGTPASTDPEKAQRMLTKLEQVTATWLTAEFWDEGQISLTEEQNPTVHFLAQYHL